MKQIKRIVIFFTSLILVSFLIFMIYSKYVNYENHFETSSTFDVEKGESINKIAEEMVRSKIAHNLIFAKLCLKIKSRNKILHYGEYNIFPHEKLNDLIDRMIEGKVCMRKLRIPSGLTNWDIIKIIDENIYLEGSFDKSVVLEGMIFADTYLYTKGDSKQSLVSKMTSSTVKNLWDAWLNRDEDLPFKSMFEVLILASVIEKEAVYFDDKRKVASVFINRLKDGQKLQSDPTVQYHAELYYGKNVKLQKSFFVLPSFYNTYYVKNLPLTAISNPSMASINAVLHPDKTNYRYFISMPNNLRLFFSKTYSEHLEYVGQMYQLRRELGIFN